MPASNYLRGKVIDHVLRNLAYTSPTLVYVSLHTGDPTAGNEVAGAWYARQLSAFVAQVVAGVTSNTSGLTFSAITGSSVTVTHFAVYDALTLGNMMLWAPLSVTKTFNPSDVPSWLAGALTVTLT